MSAAAIDRACETSGSKRAGRCVAIRHLRRSGGIRVRTLDSWDNPPPSFVKADLVSHGGRWQGQLLC